MIELSSALASVDALSGAEGVSISRDLRPAAISFARLAGKIARLLWQLAAFAPSAPSRLASPLAELIEGMAVALADAEAWLRTGLAGARPGLPEIATLSEWEMPGVPDPFAATFNVDRIELVDHVDEISDARLLSVFRNRLPELTDICDELVSSVTEPPLDVFVTLKPLLELLRTERPLLAWTVASESLVLIRKAAAADAAHVEQIFEQLRQRAELRAGSHQRLMVARRAAESATTHEGRAFAALSAYKIMVEAQLRPWGWALLRLCGAQGDMPMLAQVRDRLAASAEPLHAYLASALIPALRNADAHEEAHFDQIQGALVIDDQPVDQTTLLSSNAELAAINTGLEMALALACAQVGPVARAYSLRPGDPQKAAEALSRAEQRYGHAGLRVWSLRRDRTTVQVRLDEIDPLRFSNPCCLATLQANELIAGVTRWQIGLRERDEWAMDLPTSVLRENWPVLKRAIQWFPEIPQGTFLPCLTWARLTVELPGAALRAAAWLALNDLQSAIDEVEERAVLDVRWFGRRIQNVIGACVATLRVMPSMEAQPLEVLLQLARQTHEALVGMPLSPPLAVLVKEVLRERDRLPVPAVVPTIDRRPLTIAETSD